MPTILQQRTGGDAARRPAPRYLLPRAASAFGHRSVAGDRLYQQLRGAVAGASPSPGERIPRASEPARNRVRLGPLCGAGRV